MKRELAWRPRYATWREGFRHGLADASVEAISAARQRRPPATRGPEEAEPDRERTRPPRVRPVPGAS